MCLLAKPNVSATYDLHSVNAGLDCYSRIVHMTSYVSKDLSEFSCCAPALLYSADLGLQPELANCFTVQS